MDRICRILKKKKERTFDFELESCARIESSKQGEVKMHGIENVTFSELFKDTAKTHGVVWAWKYYKKRGMSQVEFRFWCRATLL
jgi:hypothetical protein